MRLGKLILFVVCLVLVVNSADAKLKNGALVIPKTSVAPVIDGKVDPIWNLVDATWLKYVSNPPAKISDWSDFSGWGKFMYDDKKLYGLYYVQDDVIDTVTTIDWQLDGIEMFIDANNTHIASAQLAPPKFQFNLRPAQKIDSVKKAIGHGLDYKWLLDTLSMHAGGPSGYYVEFSFSLDSLGITTPVASGKKVSFQMQTDDNDLTAAGRIHTMNWNLSPLNQDYLQTLGWGDAVFDDQVVLGTGGMQYTFLKTSTAPVIDGKLDAIWNSANQITMDYVQAQGTGTYPQCTPQDQSWRFYGLYDDKFIYGLFSVSDDVIDTTTTIDWQLDGIEFYCDVNNTHVASSQLAAPKFQFNLRPAQKIDSVKTAIRHGLDYKWTLINQGGTPNDSIFILPGYIVEFKFSLDSLGFTTPAQPGKIFSFQAQTDDNDLTAAGRVHTSNWWYSPLNQDYLQTLNWGDAKLGPLIVTSVGGNSDQVIHSFDLAQNYPNPFNPSTQITFSLLKTENVKLTVYNILGKQVAELVNETRSAGSHTVTFDATNFASGVYIYKLQAGGTVLAKKMMLLK